jgi:hypothetical protein
MCGYGRLDFLSHSASLPSALYPGCHNKEVGMPPKENELPEESPAAMAAMAAAKAAAAAATAAAGATITEAPAHLTGALPIALSLDGSRKRKAETLLAGMAGKEGDAATLLRLGQDGGAYESGDDTENNSSDEDDGDDDGKNMGNKAGQAAVLSHPSLPAPTRPFEECKTMG